MIVFEDRTWQIDTAHSNTNYLEGLDCEQPKWVIPDNSELAQKVMSTPYWRPVEDDNGQLVDIVIEEPPVSDEERAEQLKNELEEIDRLAIRPLRAIAAGNDTEEDRDKLEKLEEQAENLRTQIAEIEGKEKN